MKDNGCGWRSARSKRFRATDDRTPIILTLDQPWGEYLRKQQGPSAARSLLAGVRFRRFTLPTHYCGATWVWRVLD